MDFRWETRTSRVSAPFGIVIDFDWPSTDSLARQSLQSALCILDRIKVDEAVAWVTAREGIDGDVDFLATEWWMSVRSLGEFRAMEVQMCLHRKIIVNK